jgi:O-antigen/teichoic acid export membrane protein
MCTAGEPWVHTAPQRAVGGASVVSARNVGSVALVILLGLVIGVLGVVEDDLYTVGVLVLFIGAVGAAVLAGEFAIRWRRERGG